MGILVLIVNVGDKTFFGIKHWEVYYLLDCRTVRCGVGSPGWRRSSGLRAPWSGKS